uniref:Uncharacterized protein n=1 Tax=Termitomyces sp. TaxID=1916073 RepID=A0A3G2BS07_9AGAR|nr:hypothetical protein DXG00_000018 [Termitomyces sp.]
MAYLRSAKNPLCPEDEHGTSVHMYWPSEEERKNLTKSQMNYVYNEFVSMKSSQEEILKKEASYRSNIADAMEIARNGTKNYGVPEKYTKLAEYEISQMDQINRYSYSVRKEWTYYQRDGYQKMKARIKEDKGEILTPKEKILITNIPKDAPYFDSKTLSLIDRLCDQECEEWDRSKSILEKYNVLFYARKYDELVFHRENGILPIIFLSPGASLLILSLVLIPFLYFIISDYYLEILTVLTYIVKVIGFSIMLNLLLSIIINKLLLKLNCPKDPISKNKILKKLEILLLNRKSYEQKIRKYTSIILILSLIIELVMMSDPLSMNFNFSHCFIGMDNHIDFILSYPPFLF